METNNLGDKERYLDLTKPLQPIPQEQKQIIPQLLKEKKPKKYGLFLGILFFLTITSLGLSAYNIYDSHYLKSYLNDPEIIYSGDWDCFTEKCVGYYTMNEWADKNCNDDLTECEIDYQGQKVNLPFDKINLPPNHELLCKEYVCSTEIPIRRYLND